MNTTSVNVSLVGTSSFVPAAPTQRQFALDTTNPGYIRNATLTQDSIYLTFLTESVVFSLSNLYSVAISVNSVLGWPPVISQQPNNLTISASHTGSFTVSASVANGSGMGYSWYSQSYSQSVSQSNVWYPLVDSTTLTGSHSSSLYVSSASIGMSNSNFYCLVTGSSGTTSSSIATLTVI